MIVDTVSRTLTRIFGSRNERLVKAYRRRVDRINATESDVASLTDSELRDKTDALRTRVKEGTRIQEVLPEALAVARQTMDRAVGIRSIFNPEHGFDPSVLPDDVRQSLSVCWKAVPAAYVLPSARQRGRDDARSQSV